MPYKSKEDRAKQMREYRRTHPEYKGNELLRRFLRRRAKKIKIVAMKGGKCSKCGYHKNMAALELHHPDGDRDYETGSAYLNWSWERIMKEVIPNTVLLCSDCHQEEHHPELEVATVIIKSAMDLSIEEIIEVLITTGHIKRKR